MSHDTYHDIDILARTLWGEARGEGKTGMEAVASVILNRRKDTRWPNTIAEVCLQPRQFSCWNLNDPNRAKLLSVDHADRHFSVAYAIAAAAAADMVTDMTFGANHYLTARLFNSPSRPSWADPTCLKCAVGSHVFLQL